MFSASCVVVTASAVSNVVAPSRVTKILINECHVSERARSKSTRLAS